MSLRAKIIWSVVFQLAFLFALPWMLTTAGLRGANWIRVWEDIKEHKIFTDKASKKVVLLGDSEFGERFCNMTDDNTNTALADECALRAILDFKKKHYPKMNGFEFYDLSKNGTIAEAHLFYFLHLLELPPGQIKYVIYAAPDKFFFELHDRPYYVLNEASANKIDILPPEFQTERLKFVAKKYRERIAEYAKQEKFYFWRYRLRKAKTFFWNRRSFFQDLIGDARDILSEDAKEVGFNQYYEKHAHGPGLINEDLFTDPLDPPGPLAYFEKEEDFMFLETIHELCTKMGAKLVLYFPPDRAGCPSFHPEPCASKIYQPVIDYYRGSDVKIIDMRSTPYIYPRDTIDGVHPSLSTKLKIAKEFLDELEKMETK